MIRDALIIFRKEIHNLIKDRRTLILLLVLPLVIMPLIFGTIGMVTQNQQEEAARTVYSILVRGNGDPVFAAALDAALDWVPADVAGEETLGVEFPAGYRPGDPATVRLSFDSTSSRSQYAAGQIQAALESYNAALAEQKLQTVGLRSADLRTIQVQRVDLAPEEARSSGFLAVLLPYLIVIYLFSGSMNIGLDCTAGERERGSLASVLVNQVSRTSIALGKILYVVAAALLNSVASFVGIIVAFQFLGSRIPGAGISSGLAIFTALNTLGLLVTLLSLGLLAASLIVLLGSLAKTVREGGTYILPVYLVVIVIGVASMQADPSREMTMFLIPLVNAVFTLKEILLAQMDITHLALTLGVNLVAAGILIRLVSGLYNSERILDSV